MKKQLFILFLIGICYLSFMSIVLANDGVYHTREKMYFAGRPVLVNSIIIEPKSKYTLRLSYGKKFISTLERVKFFARQERAYAAMNASFFKPDSGHPLGLSIIDKRMITGPLLRRCAFGITRKGRYHIAKVNFLGAVNIGHKNFRLENINQPVMSRKGLYLFNPYWGKHTPKTKKGYSHLVICQHKLAYISQNSTPIPRNGYVLVGHNSLFKSRFKKGEKTKYSYQLHPQGWDKMQYAFAGGPYLVKNGKRFIDKQSFSNIFLWSKAPRSAIGIRKDGTLILVTADGRQKGKSEGVSLSEMADIMLKYEAYEAMNLDGGSSTQMVINNQLVNSPSNVVGARVTNALVIVKKNRGIFW